VVIKLSTSRTQPPAHTRSSDVRIGWVRRSLSLLLLFVAGVCFWNGLPARLADDARQAVVADARAAVRAPQAVPETGDVSLNTTPIQDIRVGQRVQAHNPEVSAKERESWDEPDWSQWQLVRLEMPKPDGSLLQIEMLRPQEWLDSQAALVVETREVIAHPGPLDVQEASAEGQVPVSRAGSDRPETGKTPEESNGRPVGTGPTSEFQPMPLVPESVPVGLVVEMDLPELGLTDLAWVTDIADCPEIESRDSGRSAGGSVVTATFHHSSGDVIDLMVEDEGVSQPSSFRPHSSKETIGTTSNHPFWSVDRQEYVQAGQLEPGERVLTFSGDTKRIASKLARPGPQPVYNLEVHAEHVYFVGEDALLVHNAKRYAPKGVSRHNGPRKFTKNNPQYKGTHEIHHSREWNVLKRYPGTFTPNELNLGSMMRPIVKGQKLHGKSLHRSHIRKSWDAFQGRFQGRFDAGNISPVKMRDLINRHAEYIDRMYLGIN
jgi:hypothetical protein